MTSIMKHYIQWSTAKSNAEVKLSFVLLELIKHTKPFYIATNNITARIST